MTESAFTQRRKKELRTEIAHDMRMLLAEIKTCSEWADMEKVSKLRDHMAAGRKYAQHLAKNLEAYKAIGGDVQLLGLNLKR